MIFFPYVFRRFFARMDVSINGRFLLSIFCWINDDLDVFIFSTLSRENGSSLIRRRLVFLDDNSLSVSDDRELIDDELE